MIAPFLQYLQSEKRYSAHTLRAYQSDLEQLVDYLSVSENDLPKVNYRQLRTWFAELIAQGLSTRSVNRKVSSVSAYFRYLVREGVLAQNPAEKIVNPKNGKRLPFFYKEEQLSQLLNGEVNDDYESRRNHAIVELLYGTGMRLSELVGLQVGDVNLGSQTVKVLGKGNKQRVIPLSPKLCEALKNYLELLSQTFAAPSESALFRTAKGEPVYAGLVYKIVRQQLASKGVVGKKSPHVLRHSFATHMLNHGADLNSIKDLLGHASLSATQVYTHNNIEKLMKSYHSAHPHA
ncbi:MAG: tyrosine recombinase XerC [Prevotellaceae bacterium]|jgi:integrase/recombinase XerC|nr:tyrosine recombinase XerC [Prevotellaceae bacterium]